MMRLDRPGGRRKGEHVVDRGDDLERALVAVPFHPIDPFGVDHARPHDLRDFLFQRPRHRPLRPRVIVVIGRRLASRQRLRRRDQSALELVVVVRIEQIVLAIVLVVHHRLDVAEPRCEPRTLRRSGGVRPIGILPPVEKRRSEVGRAGPLAGIDQRLQPRAIGAGLAAEDPVPGAERRLGLARPVPHQPQCIGPHPRRDRVLVLRLVERPDRPDRLVEQRNLLRKRIAEQSGNPERHIHPRPPQLGQWNDLVARKSERRRIPHRPGPDEGERLRKVVAARPHARRPPDRQRQRPERRAMVLVVPQQQPLGRFLPQLPRRRRRNSPIVHRVEIPPRRQHVEPPPRRRPRRSRRNEFAIQPIEQRLRLGRPRRPQFRPHHTLDLAQYRGRRRTRGRGLPLDHRRHEIFEMFDHVTDGAKNTTPTLNPSPQGGGKRRSRQCGVQRAIAPLPLEGRGGGGGP